MRTIINQYNSKGQKNGIWIYYSPGGFKIMEVNYVNDNHEGLCRLFYNSSKKARDLIFVNGKIEFDKHFDSKEILTKEIVFIR